MLLNRFAAVERPKELPFRGAGFSHRMIWPIPFAEPPGRAVTLVLNEHRPFPLDQQLCLKLCSASIAIGGLFKPMLDRLGLTYPQYLVLHAL